VLLERILQILELALARRVAQGHTHFKMQVAACSVHRKRTQTIQGQGIAYRAQGVQRDHLTLLYVTQLQIISA